jgi:hypothetical protein
LHNFIRFCKDLQGLLAIQLVLLAMTIVFAAGDAGDLRFQIAYLLFLLPGWLLSPRWTGNRSGLVKQYFHALITSFLIHAWLVAVGVFLGLGFREYFIAKLWTVFIECSSRFAVHHQVAKQDDWILCPQHVPPRVRDVGAGRSLRNGRRPKPMVGL